MSEKYLTEDADTPIIGGGDPYGMNYAERQELLKNKWKIMRNCMTGIYDFELHPCYKLDGILAELREIVKNSDDMELCQKLINMRNDLVDVKDGYLTLERSQRQQTSTDINWEDLVKHKPHNLFDDKE